MNQNDLNREVEQVILGMVSNEGFRDFVFRKMGEQVDVSVMEGEREQLRKQLRQASGAKTKLTDMLDKLDVTDRHYDRKYRDMQDRLDSLYDKMSELEDSIADINGKLNGIREKQITAQQLYSILIDFSRTYHKMTDLEKKEFFRDFIKSIELYPEKLDNETIVKKIELAFPVYYEGNEKNEIRLLNENTVECVAKLVKQLKT